MALNRFWSGISQYLVWLWFSSGPGRTSPPLVFPLMSASSSLNSSLSFLMQSKYSFCLSKAWPRPQDMGDTGDGRGKERESEEREEKRRKTYGERGEEEQEEEGGGKTWREGGEEERHMKNRSTK